MNYCPRQSEVDAIGDSIFRRYDSESYCHCKAFDIEGFITEQLECQIIYEVFATEDTNVMAFLGDGKNNLPVIRNGKKDWIIPDGNTIVLDKCLQDARSENKKRFTLAHEVGHLMIRRFPEFLGIYLEEECFEEEWECDFDAVKQKLLNEERLATQIGVAILLPKKMIYYMVRELNDEEEFVLYENEIMTNRERVLIHKMADRMKVSFDCMFIRLKSLDLFAQRAITCPFEISR